MVWSLKDLKDGKNTPLRPFLGFKIDLPLNLPATESIHDSPRPTR